MLSIAFFAFFALVSAQKWINLSALNGNSDVNRIVDNETVSIYITASSDSSTFLDLIVFSTEGMNKTATQVMTAARLYKYSDLLEPWIVQGPVNVTTSLSSQQVSALTGSIYISKSENAQVCDLTMHQSITINEPKSTIVILNSQYGVKPYTSSYISSWQQSITQEVHIFRGFPSEVRDSPIFSNPFNTTNSIAQVTNVENFNINLPIFYLEVISGVSFDISPQYVDMSGSSMSSAFTTGFYMKSEKNIEADVELHPVTSLNSNYLGVNYIGEDIPVNGYVNIGVKSSDGSNLEHQFLGSNESQWQTNVGNPLTIKSSATNAGQFYIQYYVIPGRAQESSLAPNGLTTSTTSRPISTTTQSSSRSNFVLTVLCSFLGAFITNYQ